jgi:predicted nucleotidyltransferase
MTGVATWLYGSIARGDSTERSDVDVLVVGGCPPDWLSRRFIGRRLSLSQYSWSEIRRMASYGSLFLQHLKLEGRPLDYSPASVVDLPKLLRTLPPYANVPRDLRAFQASLDDIRIESECPVSLPFELASLAALVRRIGILGAYVDGNPTFGRYQPVVDVVHTWSLPPSIASEFPTLYRYRLASEDASVSLPTDPPGQLMNRWLLRAQAMLDSLKERSGGTGR